MLTISPINISFGARIMTAKVGENGLTQEQLTNELNLMCQAQEAKVKAPAINAYSYIIEGENAHPEKNPLTKKHFDNLFEDLYRLDKTGIFHNDLDIGHVFYSQDGKVEFDCYRFGCNFNLIKQNAKEHPHSPEFMAPSNAVNYEKSSLGAYLSKTNSQKQADETVRDYLQASTTYHKKRAELMQAKGAPQEMQEFEALQAKLFKNPTGEIINLRKMRIDWMGQDRVGATIVDEAGNGACGHPKDNMRLASAIPVYMDMMSSVCDYISEADNLAEKSNDESSKKYFEYEKKFGEYWLNNFQNWYSGTANWILGKEKLNCPQVEVEKMSKMFDAIKAAHQAEKSEKITDYKNSYTELVAEYFGNS